MHYYVYQRRESIVPMVNSGIQYTRINYDFCKYNIQGPIVSK